MDTTDQLAAAMWAEYLTDWEHTPTDHPETPEDLDIDLYL